MQNRHETENVIPEKRKEIKKVDKEKTYNFIEMRSCHANSLSRKKEKPRIDLEDK